MIKLEEFLKTNVENYLFVDLRKMQKAEVGYPLLMMTFAGIELFGALVSESRFVPYGEGKDYFISYWKSYLYPSLKNSETIARTLYELARNGIAHSFVLKGQISVVLSHADDAHLTRDSSGVIRVDAVKLAQDFMDSFAARTMPLVTSTTGAVNRTSIENRLNEMETDYSGQAKPNDMSVFPLGAVAPNSGSASRGQSGASGPTFQPHAAS